MTHDRRTPLDLTPEEFASIGHRLVDDLADMLGQLRTRPLTPGESAEEIRGHLDAAAGLPEHGSDAASLMSETTRLLVDHSLFNAHPRFFGYIMGAPGPLGMLADLLAAGVNPNLGGWPISPMASEVEDQTVRWIAELVGFPSGGDGVLVSGGNVANMLGVWAARAARAGWDVRTDGMRAAEARDLRMYAARGTHTWIQKAADLSGLGSRSIRWIDVDERGRMKLSSLRTAVEEDLTAGVRPFVVVGTAGSVSTGAVDPLPALRAFCDEHDIWLHVDGAYGAFAAVASNAPDDLRGLALADSVALDPHKWLYVPLEAGCTLVKDPNALLGAFSYRPEYYAFQQEAKNFFERGIQNSRGFRALKVWLQLRQLGRSGYRAMIEGDIDLARRFHQIAGEHEALEPLTQGLSITTFRYVPVDLAARASEPETLEYLNELNREIQARMERSGEAFVSNAVLGDVYALRMCIVNFRTTAADVEALADITVAIGAAVDAEKRG